MKKDKPFWQTSSWETFQQSLGHQTTRLKDLRDEPLVLLYPLFFGYKYDYIPRGPLRLNDEDQQILKKSIEKLSKKESLVFTRIDPEEELDLKGFKRVKKSHSIQPEHTLVLDLELSNEELLKQMKRKGRYNIQLAEKKGVIIRKASGPEERAEFASIFHQLLQETTERDQFSGHNKEYYQKFLKHIPESEIFLAFYQDQPLSGVIATYQKNKAIYYYGASSNQHREVMAPYLLQWEAIQEAKRRGCKEYDFLGIAPEGAGKDHPWYGISSFKMKFGGKVMSYPQAIDIIHQPFWYQIYKVLKGIQKLVKK